MSEVSPAKSIAVVMGGPGRESAVSLTSGKAVAAGLRAAGWAVTEVVIDQQLDPSAVPAGAVVFNLVHGTYGEDGTLQDALAAAGLVAVGSDAAASRLCMDKQRTRQTLERAGVPVAWGVALDLKRPVQPRDLKLPHMAGYVLKPRCDGSSVGLYMIDSPSFLLPALEQALADVGPVSYLLEERLPGPEYTVAIIDDADGQPQAQPPLQITPASGQYDYHAKYQADTTRYEVVEDGALAAALRSVGLQSHQACGCRDLSRVDVMAAADGSLRVLEVNTLPGFTDHSLVPKAAAAAGTDFPSLVDHLASLAYARLGDDEEADDAE